jgi:hypothetical protein
MTSEAFFAGLTGSKDDLRLVAGAFERAGHGFCLIGGLAVNHYVEPVVTLDADFAIVSSEGITPALRDSGFTVEEHAHSINAQIPGSRLRIQITLDTRYREFPSRAVLAELFGVRLPIAALEDIVQGKLWAIADPARRASKSIKDKADLARICESWPAVIPKIPRGIIPEVDAMRSR